MRRPSFRFGRALSLGCAFFVFGCAAPDGPDARSTGGGGAASELAPYCEPPSQPPDPEADLAAFSDYAWRLYVALNWPANSGARGVPNCDAPIGSRGPTVWETYKTTQETFLPGARPPGPWNAGLGARAPFDFIAKAPDELPVEDAIDQAVGGWLIDQRGHPTYYQISVNQASYDYVVDNRFYNANIVNQANRVSFPDGAMEVKAAWRIMDGVDPERFLTTRARVMAFDRDGQPTGVYQDKSLGLVGLHIVHKPAGFPQWIWTTFEHVDNAPLASDAGAAGSTPWSYYDPDCAGAYCEPNVSPQKSGQPVA